MVQVKDLVDISDDDYKQRQGEYVKCLDCGASFGGTRGDYWKLSPDFVFKCDDPDCRSENLALVKDVTTTITIKK